MTGSIRKLIIRMLQGLLVACIAFCALSLKSMAAGESSLQFVPVQDGYYALAGTESQDVDTSTGWDWLRSTPCIRKPAVSPISM